MKIRSTLLVIPLFFSVAAFGQSIERSLVGSSGSSFSNGTVQVEQSIGEALVSDIRNGNSAAQQGFQQANDIVSAVETAFVEDIAIFPNPFADYLNISGTNGPTIITIYNMQGKLVRQIKMSDATTILLSDLAAGIYHVNIIFKDNTLTTSRQIQKI